MFPFLDMNGKGKGQGGWVDGGWGGGRLLISASALPSGGKGLRDGRMDKSIQMCSTAGGTKGRRLGQKMRLSFLPPFFSVSLRPRLDSVDGQEDIYIYR